MKISSNGIPQLGNTMIDNDHRYIFSLLNELFKFDETFLSSGFSIAEVKATLAVVAEECRRHFSKEEEIMDMALYPNSVRHKIEHKLFLEDLVMYINRIHSNANSNELSQIQSNLIAQFIMHICDEDKGLIEYISERSLADIVTGQTNTTYALQDM